MARERSTARDPVGGGDRRFQAIFESASVGIATLSLDGVILEANPALERMLGYPPGALIGVDARELVLSGDSSDVGRQLGALTQGLLDVYHAERRYVRADGSVIWGRISVSLIRDELGEPSAAVGVFEDVNARRQAEQQLREAEERYRVLVEELPLVTYIDALDDRSSNLYTSPQIGEMLGYTAEEWQSNPDLFVEVLHPDDRERVLAEVARANATGERFVSEYRMIARDGRVVVVRDECVVVRDASGAPLYSQGYLLDITERHAAEQELRESETRFRSMADDAPVLIWTADPDGSVTFLSKSWLEFVGASLEEQLGAKWLQTIHPDDRDELRAVWVDAVARRQRFEVEYRLRRADGEYRWIRDRGGPHHRPDGTFVGFVGVGIDVTDEKEARNALERRERVLEAVAAIAGDIVATSGWEDVDVLARLGGAAGATRAHLLEIRADEGGGIAVQRAEWTPPDVADSGAPGARPAPFPLGRWHDVLSRGHVVRAAVRELPDEQRRAFAKLGVRSVVVVPIVAEGALWGLLAFGDRAEDRRWSDAEVDALRIAAGILGAAIARQRAESALGEATARLEAIVENSPLAIVTSDTEGIATGWNPAAERLFGWTRDEVIGKVPPHFVPGDDEGSETRRRAEQGELVTDAEAKRRRKDGSIVDVRYAKAPLRDAHGELLGTLAILTDISERKRVEERLRESEARFAAFMNNLDAVAYIKDEGGRYVWVNPTFEKQLGWRAADVVGRLDTELFDPESAERYRRLDQEARASGMPIQQLEERAGNGGTRYWLHLKFPFESAAGGSYVGGVSIDVTERERAQRALRETTMVLEAIVDCSPVAIVTYDREGRVAQWNQAAEKMFGWTADEVVGRRNPAIPPGEESDFQRVKELALDGRTRKNVEMPRRTKDGRLLEVSVSSAPLRDASGETIGMVAILDDVTERKRMERRLLETTQTLESLVDAAPLGIIIFDSSGRVVSWNPAAERLFGWSESEAVGRFNPTVVPGEEEDFHEAVRLALAGNSWQDVHRSARCKDGRVIEISASCAPVAGANGEPVGMVAIIADITSRRRAERRVAAQHRVTAILADSSTLDEAGPRVIEELCKGLGWDVGCVWTVEPGGRTLTASAVWHHPERGAAEFARLTERWSVAYGEGPAGRAWATGEPQWLWLPEGEMRSGRERWAQVAGLRVVAAVPFRSGSETLGVLELAGRAADEADEDVLALLASVGRQLGEFVRRAEADAAVREREERFRTLVANVPGTIYRCADDEHWTRSFISDAIEELSGYPASDFVGNAVRRYTDIVHPADRDGVTARLAEAVAAREPYTLEYRIVHRDGEIRWVSENGQPVVGPDGEVLWLDGVIFDVTERKRVERDLAQTMALLDSIVENLPVMLFLKDASDLRFVRVNRAMEEIMGRSREELLGKSDHEVLPAEQAQRFEERDRQVLASGELVDVQEEPLADRYLHTRKVPILDERGEIRYLLGISMDVTESRRAARERERLVAQLEQQNEQLRQLDRMKDEFVALVSHELRTPLTSILGYIELLLDGDAGEINSVQERFLRIIERNSRRLLRLVGDLLLVAQIEAGALKVEHRAVDLGTIARECVEAARPTATEKGIEIVLEGDAGRTVLGDETRLAQLLDNLVSNAIKFTPAGGRVGVTLTTDNGRVRVSVSNTGPGIPLEEQERLFQRFYRTRAATENAIPGTGLGLTITKAIAEAHGGSISVESAEDEGTTTFVVDLPATGAQAGAPGSR